MNRNQKCGEVQKEVSCWSHNATEKSGWEDVVADEHGRQEVEMKTDDSGSILSMVLFSR